MTAEMNIDCGYVSICWLDLARLDAYVYHTLTANDIGLARLS